MHTQAPYAALEEYSRGRHHKEAEADYRSPYQRDRDRIIHSASFRRLEYKTQVFVNHEGDMYRTRLTHSIEVAQIGRTIARALSVNEDLTEAICLAHDLGHTPFGHVGQDSLNQCMTDYGGFEHNLQSLRIVDKLEEKYAEFQGLNLTFETREGILKHCSKKNAQLLGDIGQRFLSGHMPSLEAQIANMADGIAYNNHDIDDGLRSGLLNIPQLTEYQLFSDAYHDVIQRWPDLTCSKLRHEIVRRMINRQVQDLVATSRACIEEVNPDHIDAVREAGKPLIRMSEPMRGMDQLLRQGLYKRLYKHKQVQATAAYSREVIATLFAIYKNNPSILHETFSPSSKDNIPRQIADYISGMTDRFAIAECARLKALYLD